jgi:hypothetical protein
MACSRTMNGRQADAYHRAAEIRDEGPNECRQAAESEEREAEAPAGFQLSMRLPAEHVRPIHERPVETHPAGFNVFWVDGKSGDDVRWSLNQHPAFSSRHSDDISRILGDYTGEDITNQQYDEMMSSDCVICSFLNGDCVKIVNELNKRSFEQRRDMPVLALVSKRNNDTCSASGVRMTDAMTRFDIVATKSETGPVRQHMLNKLEYALDRRIIWKNEGWERWWFQGDAYLWKHTGERGSEDGDAADNDNTWKCIKEVELEQIPTGQIKTFLLSDFRETGPKEEHAEKAAPEARRVVRGRSPARRGLVKLQITIGLAARKSVVINVDADASVGQIKARLKQVVDVDWSKLDFSKLDLIIGRGTEKVNLSNEFDYDKIMNIKRMKNIVKSNREGDCVPCCLVGLVVENILIMMERNRPETERHAKLTNKTAKSAMSGWRKSEIRC